MSAGRRPFARIAISLAAAVLLLAVVILAWLAIDRLAFSREDVHIHNGDIRLAGTVTRPRTGRLLPAVVLLHGSGPESRDRLRSYTRMFARHGFAALAYDKRGVGESQGDPDAWRRFSFHDLAGDAAAAVDYLRSRDDVDAYNVGLFAVSQGCWVAPLAVKKTGHVAFMIQVSASVTTVAEDRLFERSARLRHEGFSEEEFGEARRMQVVDQEVTRSGKRFEEFKNMWDEHTGKRWFKRVYPTEEPIPPDHDWRRWYRTVIDFDPVAILDETSVPALWIFGDPSLDRFAPVESSIEALNELQARGKDYRIVVYPGTDHSVGGSRSGFSAVWNREPVFEDELFQWLEDRVGVNRSSRSMVGTFAYMADAGLFADCLTGDKLPVAHEGDNAALERAYLSARKEPAAPVLVTVEGHVAQRPRMEGGGTRDFLIVERFVGAWPGETCESSRIETQLTNTYWKLVELDGTPAGYHADQPELHIILEREGGQVRGFAGCNRFFGDYAVDGRAVEFGQIASTMTTCPHLDQEAAFFSALQKVTGYEIMGESLELRRDGETRLRFRAVSLE